MLERIDLLNTIDGSLFQGFFPKAWDLGRIDNCCSRKPEEVYQRETWWHQDFQPVCGDTLSEFNTLMGHEIAYQIKLAKDEGRELILILSAGPMGMYQWAARFLNLWNVDCKHVHGFNMDEWSDAEGNTLPASNPGAFRNAMESALYGPLGKFTVPEAQRHFATKVELPTFGAQIDELRAKGAKFVLIYGIGWVLDDGENHIYTFPAFTFFTTGAVDVHTRIGNDTAIDLYWGLNDPIWTPGKVITLRDANDIVQSTFLIPER